MRTIALAVIIGLATACQPHSQPIDAGALPPGGRQAITAAKQQLVEQGWNIAEIEVTSARDLGGFWRVSARVLPGMPGGHATVDVGDDGKVIRLYPGL